MMLYKDDLYDKLLKAGQDAGLCVTGELYFRKKTGEKIFQNVQGVWPDGQQKSGQPDCIWMKDGTPVAVFEIEGYDVEDKYTGGLIKDGIYLSSPIFKNCLKAIILFGLKENRKDYKNSIKLPTSDIRSFQKSVKLRAQRLPSLYNMNFDTQILLDDDLDDDLLSEWGKIAQGVKIIV